MRSADKSVAVLDSMRRHRHVCFARPCHSLAAAAAPGQKRGNHCAQYNQAEHDPYNRASAKPAAVIAGSFTKCILRDPFSDVCGVSARGACVKSSTRRLDLV